MNEEKNCAFYERAAQLPEHDCFSWNLQVYVSRKNYTASECALCKSITGFRWRSWWRRVASLFTDKRFRRVA